jgi:hypothetical protein
MEGYIMSRPKGSKNKPKPATDGAFEYTLEQRMKIVADLVVEKIIEDQSFGSKIADILGIRVDNGAKQ